MVDEKDKLPEHDAGSLLKSAVAGSPFVAGVGIASYRAYQEGGVQAVPASVKEAAKTLSKIKKKVSTPSYNAHLDFMNGAQKKGWFKGTGAAAARTAWVQAMASAGEFSARFLPKTARSIGDLPDDQIMDALRALDKSETDVTSTVFSRFRQNFFALQGLPAVPTFSQVKGLAFDIGPEIKGTSVPEQLAARLTGIGPWTSTYYSRPGFMEEGLGMYQVEMGVAGRQLKFNLPISSRGAAVEGLTQASRRISPDVGLVDPESRAIRIMKREEYFLEELEKSVIKDIKSGRFQTQGDITRAVNDLYTRVYSELESIPNVPGEFRSEALQKYQELRGQAVDLMIEDRARRQSGRGLSTAYRPTTVEETTEMIARHGLFPGTGAEGLASGRVQRVNLAQQTLFPEAVDWSRKPEAAIRPFQLTQESADVFNKGRYASYKDYEAMNNLNHDLKMRAPHLKTLYVDPKMFGEELGMGEGTILGRGGLSEDISHQWLRTQHLKVVQGQTPDEFVSAVQAGRFKPGDVLGWDESGSVVKMQEDAQLLQAIKNRTESKGEFITIVESNASRLRTNEKWFGDFKGLMRLTQEMWFRGRVRKITNLDQFAQDVDVIVSMDELKKDPSKFAKQVLTGITETVRGRGALPPGTLAADVALRPRHYAELLQQQAMVGGGFSTTRFTERAMSLAGELGFTQREFGSVFGATPYVLGTEKAAELAIAATGGAPGYAESIGRGWAGGISRAVYGGPEELRGAGALASIEPRAFETFRGPAFAGIPGITEDILTRMQAADPRALKTHQELSKTIMSMGGLEKAPMGARVFDVQKEFMAGDTRAEFQRFIEQGGGWMRPGKGLHDVYVPGAQELSAIRPYTTQTGKTISGDIAGLYHRMVAESSRMYSGASPVGPAQVRGEFENIMQDILKEQAPAGKGQGAYLRSKVLGGRFFTGVDEAGGFRSRDPVVAGIPQSHAERMFEEMKDVYGESEIKEMRRRFMAGEEIGGVIGRHPFIGEYSLQPMLFKRHFGDQPQIAIPEFATEVGIKGTSARSTIKLGPLLGMAGDKDADLFSAMLVRPDVEKEIRNTLRSEDSDYLQRYTQHQVRYQLLKAKGVAGADEGLPTLGRMIAGVEKLAVTPEWVPQLSLEMAKAKRAVRQFGTGAEAADATMLLEWLEQTPISSKHLSAKAAAEGELRAGMAQLTMAFKERDPAAMREVVTDILEGNKLASSLLKGDVEIEAADAESIRNVMGMKSFSSVIPQVDLNKALHTVTSSLDKYRSSGAETEMNILSARGRRASEEVIAEVAASQKAAMSLGDEGFRGVAKAMLSSTNKLGSFGAGLLKHHKPIGIGFAAALGIGAVLSTPQQLVGSGQALIPEASIPRPGKAANQMKPESVNPIARSVGRPTAPNMLNQRNVMISPPAETKNLHVRAQAARLKSGAVIDAVRRMGGQNRRVNVNLQDSRSSINEHVMANKLI